MWHYVKNNDYIYSLLIKKRTMSIKHLTPRSPEELDSHERTLFSGRLLREMTYDEVIELRNLIIPISNGFIDQHRKIAKSPFHKGQNVSWSGRDGRKHSGTLIRLNARNASLREDNGYTRWSVAYQYLIIN